MPTNRAAAAKDGHWSDGVAYPERLSACGVTADRAATSEPKPNDDDKNRESEGGLIMPSSLD
jgi:hypothetical protein